MVSNATSSTVQKLLIRKTTKPLLGPRAKTDEKMTYYSGQNMASPKYILPIIGQIEQSQWYVVFSQFCSSVADLGHFHLTWSLEDNWLYHTSLLELQLTARKKLCPMYSRHNEAKTQMKYSGNKIRKTQSVHLPENHLSKFDWFLDVNLKLISKHFCVYTTCFLIKKLLGVS